MANKIRLDLAVFEKGFAPSREKAKAMIMAGQVYVNQQKCLKAGTEIKPDDQLEVRGNALKYVSRGGLKLEKAMKAFPITLTDTVCMDVGASTGGFTDCMLQNGAKKVYAIDVGYGQLAWTLRNDPRVVNLERTNFRYVNHEQVPCPVDFASVDVSFISLKLILPVLHNLLADNGQAVTLIKPQFEAGKDKVGKKGVVREITTHYKVVERILNIAVETGFAVKGFTYSPVKGPEGNIEYLMYIEKSELPSIAEHIHIHDVVDRSHEELV